MDKGNIAAPYPAKVFLFQTGRVVSYDRSGDEIGELSGWRGDVRQRILTASDERTEFFEVAIVGRARTEFPLERF